MGRWKRKQKLKSEIKPKRYRVHWREFWKFIVDNAETIGATMTHEQEGDEYDGWSGTVFSFTFKDKEIFVSSGYQHEYRDDYAQVDCWETHSCRAVSYTHLTLPTKRIV